MTAVILDGKRIASQVLESVTHRARLLEERDVHPCLAFVMIGDSPPAQMYMRRLKRLASPAGIHVTPEILPAEATVSQLERTVGALSADEAIDAVLIQMPLPERSQHSNLSTTIDPRKDVDGITVENAGRLYLGLRGQLPSTAAAMLQILDSAGVTVTRRHCVVVGRSNVVGHPLAELLLLRDATLSVVHRQTCDLASLTRQADILFVAAGEPGLITGEMIKAGVVILDAGINVTPSAVVGDVDFQSCLPIASAITPVPGGVGPVTNAVLLRHVVDSAEQRHE